MVRDRDKHHTDTLRILGVQREDISRTYAEGVKAGPFHLRLGATSANNSVVSRSASRGQTFENNVQPALTANSM